MASPKKRATRKKKKTSKRATKHSVHSFRLLLSTLFLVFFVGSCLYGLVHLQQTYPEKIAPTVERAPMEEPQLNESHDGSYADVYQLVEDELLTGKTSQGWQLLSSTDGVRRIRIFGRYPDQRQLMELATKIALTGSPAQLDLAPRKGYVRLLWAGHLRLELRYDVTGEMQQKKPLVAIIMDDMGRSPRNIEELLNLKIPVTPAILPQAEHIPSSISLLQRADREYIIHIPMQPKSYPSISPGPNALLVDLDEHELRHRVRQYLQLVPGAVGGNNHMGSMFTQERAAMGTVLEELKRNDLFFIDSKTISGSVAFDEARRLGLRTGQRNIFLDNEEDVAYIRTQLRKMVKIAEEKGEAIAICHPYRETFDALREEEAWLRQQPVDFVVVSRLVRKR